MNNQKAIFRAAIGAGLDPLDAWDKAQQEATTWQQDVRAFHEAFDLTIATEPGFSDQWLRSHLLEEEVAEFRQAVMDNYLTGAVDAIADIIYVALGAAVTFGIDMAPVWPIVHASNMAKVGGGKNAEGKVLKPHGWTPPDVKREVLRQVADARHLRKVATA